MSKIVCISDTHTKHNQLEVPKGDVLIFAGDAEFRTMIEVIMFNQWLGELPHKEKIVISGNHDFYAENNFYQMQEILTNAVYLENHTHTLNCGLKVFGSPITPKFHDWAFMETYDKIHKYWDIIPDDTDILVTHGPAFGILDIADKRFGSLGCPTLLKAINRIKPKYHVFGHIHESHGKKKVGKTTHVNCSVLDDYYSIAYDPIIIEG